MVRSRIVAASSAEPETTPPITSPCPLMYLVREWMTMVAPSVAGLTRIGVAKVASIARAAPFAFASAARADTSLTRRSGFAMTSA